MKKKFILCLTCMIPLMIFSQNKDTTYWKNSLKTGITFNQASFSENWKTGGNNSISFGWLLFGKASYQKGKIDWVSQADMQYGKVKNEGQDLRKSVDKIFLDSKIGYKVNSKWNAYSSLSFLSQFDNGFNYSVPDSVDAPKISGFCAPAFITSSWGAEYKPNDIFYTRVAPFSPRITILNDTIIYHTVPENYGVKPGETVRYEWLAFKISAGYMKTIVENITLKADYELFANLSEIKADNIDHRLDILVTAKIYKFVNLTITNNYIYDIDQDKKLQSSILIGLSFLLNYEK